MTTYPELSDHDRAVLRALMDGPAVGIRAVAERAAGRQFGAQPDVAQLQAGLASVRALVALRLVHAVPMGMRLHIRLARAGMRAAKPRHAHGPRTSALPMATLLTLAALSGCASHVALPARQPLMGFPSITGMGQVRDTRTGESVFVPCNPCAAPTTKTPAAIALAEPLPRTPAPPPTLMRGNLVATLAEPAERPSSAPSATQATPSPAAAPRRQPTHVLFPVATAKLDPEAASALRTLATAARGAASVTVTGKTDITGSSAHNLQLALARARAVRAALIAAGVPAAKILTGTCVDCYAAPNDTEEGRRQNRRAEIVIDA